MLWLALLLLVGLPLELAGAKKKVTPEAAARRAESSIGSPVWSHDGQTLAYEQDGAIQVIPASGGHGRLVVKNAELEDVSNQFPEPERFGWRNRRVKEQKIQWFPSGEELLVCVNGDLFRVRTIDGEWTQLTTTALEEFDAKISPDGRLVSFVRELELWVLELSSGKISRLTQDATETRWNGVPDWVYPEELALQTAHWWSPDGRSIAYLQFDVSAQETYPHADLLEVRAVAEPQRFPKAGTKNATVRLGIVPSGGGKTRWLDVEGNNEQLLARVHWLPGSRALAVVRMNRLQNRLELLAVPAGRGKLRTLLVETDPHWINLSDDFRSI
ncbi:MAG: hypothetical protein GY953_51270, partial [bacterium]|nr:hypothetical protein [bacterium]